MLDTLMNGGPFTWAIILWALGLYVAIFREIGKQRARFAPALWSGLLGMVLLGLFAMGVGFMEAGHVTVAKLPLVLSIAVIPLTIATALAIPASLLIGVSLGIRAQE